MKVTNIIRSAFALAASAVFAFAQEKNPTEAEQASMKLTEVYVAAFNKGDARAVGELYAEDIHYRNDDGEEVTGRADAVAALTEFFARNKGAELSVALESSRFLTPDVLVETGLATVAGETTRYVCSYVRKDGKWLIAELNENDLPPVDEGAVALGELGWLVGSWKDGGNGPAVTTETSWTNGENFLRRSITVQREGEDAVTATEVIGYDAVAGQVRSWVFDSAGGFSEGTWAREENKWIVSSKSTARDGSTTTAQHVLTFVEDGKYTWESINRQRDGEVLPNIDKVEIVRTAGE